MDKICVNPFIYNVSVSSFNKLWLFVATFTLFPFRLVTCSNLLMIADLYSMFALKVINTLELKKLNNYHQIKKIFQVPCFTLLRLTLFFAGFLRIKIKEEKNENKINKCKIYLLAPHTSLIDFITLLLVCKDVTIISHLELKNLYFSFLYKNIIKLIFYNQSKIKSKISCATYNNSSCSHSETYLRIKDAIKNHNVIICPESISTNGKFLLKFNSDAFLLGLPVQPLYINYDNYLFFNNNPMHYSLNTIISTKYSSHALKLIWLTLCQFSFTITVNKLPVYTPNKDEILNHSLFANNVRFFMSRYGGHILSEYINDDALFFKLANETNTPRSPACIKLLKLCYKATLLQSQLSPPVSPSLQIISSSGKALTTIPEKEVLDKCISNSSSNGNNVNNINGKCHISAKNQSVNNKNYTLSKSHTINNNKTHLCSKSHNSLSNKNHCSSNGKCANVNGKCIKSPNGNINLNQRKLSIRKPVIFQNDFVPSHLESIVIGALNNMKSSYKEIKTVTHLIEVLNLDYAHYFIANNYAQELFDTLCCTNLSVDDSLIVTLLLCNLKKPDLWDRIQDCFVCLSDDSKHITINQMQSLVWFLVGINYDQLVISENLYGFDKVTFSFLRINLSNMFRNAIEENAPTLLNTC